MKFKIKICGLTNLDDAVAAVDAGADAVGLNFYPHSKRRVATDVARQIVGVVGNRADKIGVFVNESADRIREICAETSLHLVQLHGDEPPEFLRLLNKDHDLIRAYRFGDRGLLAIDEDLQACSNQSGFCPDAILVDAAVAGEYGGTGHRIEWDRLADQKNMLLGGIPLILAGGLTPENVADAIRVVRPNAVDVASGVESSPGKKDVGRMRDFIAAAREAFAAL